MICPPLALAAMGAKISLKNFKELFDNYDLTKHFSGKGESCCIENIVIYDQVNILFKRTAINLRFIYRQL
jgi:hypothetical protein